MNRYLRTTAAAASLTPGDEFIQAQSEPASIVNLIGATALQAAMPAAIATFLGGTIPIVIAGMVGVAIVAVAQAAPPFGLTSAMILVSCTVPYR